MKLAERIWRVHRYIAAIDEWDAAAIIVSASAYCYIRIASLLRGHLLAGQKALESVGRKYLRSLAGWCIRSEW